jgi:hypothetical protein
MSIQWGNQPTQPPLNPPEPSLRDLVTCEQCGEDLSAEDCHNVGSETFPIWICRGTSCLLHFTEDAAAENIELQRENGELRREMGTLRNRTNRLIETVTHGVGPDGYHDYGRWDIFAGTELPESYLVIQPNPDHGRYRVVQLPEE